MEQGKKELVQAIRREIGSCGPIPFARFMEMALYYPGLGYYQSHGEKSGPKGDYFTSPNLDPAFGMLIGRQVTEMGRLSPIDQPFTWVEMGSGKGLVTFDLLESLKGEPFFKRLEVLLIEQDPWMRERAALLLKPFAPMIRWLSSIEELPPISGCCFSNELADAFPVHRLVVEPAAPWREIYVEWGERPDGSEGFIEKTGPLSPPAEEHRKEYLKGLSLERRTILEISPLAVRWMKKVGTALTRGWVVTIDYGYPREELLFRPSGTLMGYYRHQATSDPYARVGLQDLTAHVDFSALAQGGREVGLEVEGFTDQTSFLIGLGIVAEMEPVAQAAFMEGGPEERGEQRRFRAMKALIDPGGIGSIFKVLIQSKGVGRQGLLGLKFRPFSDRL